MGPRGGGRSQGLRLRPAALLLLLLVEALEDEPVGADDGVLKFDDEGVGVVDEEREDDEENMFGRVGGR